jgi:hypothetical protein
MKGHEASPVSEQQLSPVLRYSKVFQDTINSNSDLNDADKELLTSVARHVSSTLRDRDLPPQLGRKVAVVDIILEEVSRRTSGEDMRRYRKALYLPLSYIPGGRWEQLIEGAIKNKSE